MTRTNLFRDPRATLATNFSIRGGGGTTANESLTIVAASGPPSETAARVTALTGVNATNGGEIGSHATNAPVSLTAGQVVTASFWARASLARSGVIRVRRGGTVEASAAIALTTAWARYSVTFTVSTTTTYQVQFLQDSSPTWVAGHWIDMTSVMFEVSAELGSYFDGSTPDTDLLQRDWVGAVNASASTENLVLVSPVPQDPLYRGQRREYYRVDLMTNRDGTIGQLDGVGEVSLSYDGDPAGVLTTTGSLSLDDLGQNLNWLNARCQPWADVNGEAWPLGVYIMSAPTEQHEPTGRTWSVLLKDKLSILDEDLMAENYALDTGDNIVDAIRQLIADAGEANHAISADPRVLSGPLTWPPATSRLVIIQELLKMLNFAPLWVDGWGQYVGEPFVDPQDRPIEGYFEEGVNSIHLPSFQVTMDVASVPNRLIGVVSNSGGGLMIIADNEDPTNPYSIPARGRVVARQEDFEAADLTALAALVVRRMQELMAPGSTVEFQHAIVPLRPSSVVRFTSDGVDLDGVVLSTSVALAAGEMMQTVVQEVVRVDLTVS